MSFMLHLDHPSQFTVYLDGAARGHILRKDAAWFLCPLTEPKASVEVTDLMFVHDELESRVRQHLVTPSKRG